MSYESTKESTDFTSRKSRKASPKKYIVTIFKVWVQLTFYFFIVYLFVCVHVHMHVCGRVCVCIHEHASQRTAYRSCFVPNTMQAGPSIKLRLPGFVAGVFTHWVISLAQVSLWITVKKECPEHTHMNSNDAFPRSAATLFTKSINLKKQLMKCIWLAIISSVK